MKVSVPLLQTLFEQPLPETAVLADALLRHTGEVEDITETTFEFSVLADRGHDLYSHMGIARELERILPGLTLKELPVRPLPEETALVSVHAPFDGVSLYSATLIQGVRRGVTPDVVREALEALDQRLIDPVVDITNYILHVYGTPFHAFDARSCKTNDGYVIGARTLTTVERVSTLSGEVSAPSDSIVIENGQGTVIGLGGIKGGSESGISDTTADIILEAAIFNGNTIRKTSKAVGIRTDASSRFEHGFAPELIQEALPHALALIQEAVGGEVVGMAYTGTFETTPTTIKTTISHLRDRVLGIDIGDETVVQALTAAGSIVEVVGDDLHVTPPVYRLDILRPEDLADEVVRIVGYERLVERDLPVTAITREYQAQYVLEEVIRDALVESGYSEVMTRSFKNAGQVEVMYPLASDKGFLRADLTGGVADALVLNERNMALLSVTEIRMFEIGTVFTTDNEERHLAVGLSGKKVETRLREMLASVSERTGIQFPAAKIVGNVLEVSIQGLPVIKTAELNTVTAGQFQPYSLFPYISRDISVWAPGASTEADFLACITDVHPEYLRNQFIVDRFEKEGRVSISARLVFQSNQKTLTDEEVEIPMQNIISALQTKGYEVR